jgi:hypothetical protein
VWLAHLRKYSMTCPDNDISMRVLHPGDRGIGHLALRVIGWFGEGSWVGSLSVVPAGEGRIGRPLMGGWRVLSSRTLRSGEAPRTIGGASQGPKVFTCATEVATIATRERAGTSPTDAVDHVFIASCDGSRGAGFEPGRPPDGSGKRPDG